ncbi:hypothetical protein [Palleronia sp.]|uniref:hypothetical protein n=1 Tax=Palleronia sp. TaxID=1940284 RepID=UPI0035C85316
MKGWKLFRHSVAMISRDVGAAFRVTGLPYVIILAVSLAFPAFFSVDPEVEMSFTPAVLVAAVAYFAASLWLAVQWHRYVLTGEIQRGIIPPWHGKAILAYLGRSTLLAVIAIPIFLILFIPVGILAATGMALGVLVLLGAAVEALGLAILGRFSPILPAAALREPLSLGQAWRATEGATGAILVAAVLLSLLSTLPAFLFLVGLGVIATVANLAFQWLLTLLTVSLMTTIYGHYVEGRELT